MPPGRRYQRRTRNAPKSSAARVKRNAKRYKGAKAQSGQIVKLARAVDRLQDDLKEDTEVHASYRMEVAFNCIPHSETLPTPVNRSGIMIVPLTSGPNAVTPADPVYPCATGNFSDSGGNLVFGNCAWAPWVRPRAASAVNWMKLYKQTVKVRFDANRMTTPVTYNVFLLRVARTSHGETNSANTMMDTAKRIDGTKFIGNSSSGASGDVGLTRNIDYISSVALKYTKKDSTGDGNKVDTDTGTLSGVPNGAGNDVMFNQNYYETVAHRKFTLGPQPNPFYNQLPTTTQASIGTASSVTTPNRMSQDLTFHINYGGAKLSAIDGSGPGSIDQIQDVHYNEINPKLKHWLVICPNIEAAASNALCSINSVVSCKLPA